MKNQFIHRLPSQPLTIQPTIHNQKQKVSNRTSFSDELKQAIGQKPSLVISKHAEKRMVERNIQIEPNMWAEIDVRVNEAKKKGVRDSLVLLKDAALIVSAKNNTVITAMDRQEARHQVFTNINGTIVLD